MDIRVPEFHLGLFSEISYEPLLLHRPGRAGCVVFCTSLPARGKGKGPWRPKVIDVDDLGAKLAAFAPRADCSYYITQHTFRP